MIIYKLLSSSEESKKLFVFYISINLTKIKSFRLSRKNFKVKIFLKIYKKKRLETIFYVSVATHVVAF